MTVICLPTLKDFVRELADPGSIALPNNLNLVMGDVDCLKWSKTEDGAVAVEIDPDWLGDAQLAELS